MLFDMLQIVDGIDLSDWSDVHIGFYWRRMAELETEDARLRLECQQSHCEVIHTALH